MEGSLRVPPAHRQVLLQLAELTGEDFARVRDAVIGDGLAQTSTELRAGLKALELLDQVIDVERLVEALLGVSGAQTWMGLSSQQVAEAVGSDENLELEEEQRAELTNRLAELVSSASVQVLSKGLDVATDHAVLYLRSRMLTDIRPVYNGSYLKEPAGAVITHTLRLDVQENGEQRTIYVALDQNDLRQLTDTLERESEKTDGLVGLLARAELTLIEVATDELDSDDSEGGVTT